MNIDYMKLLTENRNATAEYGCLMAMIDQPYSEKIVNFGKQIVREDILFIKDGEFGRDTEPHVTIKYGFYPDITELEIRSVFKNTKPFPIVVIGLSLFTNNPEYDVVKFDVESPVLRQLRQKCESFPNRDEFPEYHPHLTLAYVKKQTFGVGQGRISMIVNAGKMCYSPIVGGKSYFSL